jgi:periplasmic protein TonB
MITKLSFLTWMFPGLFRRLPAATSAGYRMPHERYFFYGAAFSALLHVAVLYGFRPPLPPPPPAHVISGDDVAKVWDRPMEVELPPPPPEPAPASTASKAADPAADDSTTPRATIPEPLNPVIPGIVSITGDPNVAGVAPNTDNLRWEVPKTSASSGLNGKNGRLVPLEDLDDKPVATSRAAPRYPSEMRRNGIAGTVLLRFIVDNRGDVTDVEVVSTDHSEFGRAASEAMLRWKFKPGMKNGRRVNTRMEMPMTFSMEKEA